MQTGDYETLAAIAHATGEPALVKLVDEANVAAWLADTVAGSEYEPKVGGVFLADGSYGSALEGARFQVVPTGDYAAAGWYNVTVTKVT